MTGFTGAQSSSVSLSSTDTMTEVKREDLNTSNPRGNSALPGGINVAQAEAEFLEMSRQMSGVSRTESRRISRTQSRRVDEEKEDPEKVDFEEEDEPFDLEQHLRGNESSEREAGIKPKRIGMTFLMIPMN